MIVSLQHTPPDDVFAMIVLRSDSLSLKMYNANGLSLERRRFMSASSTTALVASTYSEFMNLMASKAFPTFMIGRTGPKISSCITGSVGLTSTRIVGSMNFSSESVLPPTATFPLFKKPATRLKSEKQFAKSSKRE